MVAKTAVGLKKKLGFLGYFLSLISSKTRLKTFKFEIQTRENKFKLEGNSLVVFNAVNYHGLKPRRKIFLDDGMFSLFVFTSKTLGVLLASFVFSLSHQKPPVKTFALDNDYFKIVMKEPMDSAQIDGDYIKLPKVIEIKIKPQILKVIVR